MQPPALDPIQLLRPRRKITGMSAVLLPFQPGGEVDWSGFCADIVRTVEAGLTPAVNMDTGYINFIDEDTRVEVLTRTRITLSGGAFVAGAFVGDRPGDPFNRDAYLEEIEVIAELGGTPVIFQSYGLTEQSDDALINSYAEFGKHCDRFIGFELGTMFADFGKIYTLETYERLLGIKQCIGAKHSSLSRELEWRRLMLRDAVRPDFHVFTGNDLAIDMVMYGSDYLLGLSTMAPDLFARRDAYWAAGDPAFYELNDVLQYLGFLAFRAPVPAYKHTAAQFMKLRGWIACDSTHPRNQVRPDSDLHLLKKLGRQLDIPMEG